MNGSERHIDLDEALALKRRILRYGRPEDTENCVSVSQRVVVGGSSGGGASRITLRSGFHLSAYDIEAQTDSQAASRSDPCLAIVIILAGSCEGPQISQNDVGRLRYEPGRCYLSYVSATTQGSASMSAGGRLQLVDLRLSLPFLETLGAGDFLSGLTPTHPLYIFHDETFWLGAAETPATMFEAAARVFDAALGDNQTDVQLERAALSILDGVFQLFSANPSQPAGNSWPRKAVVRAHRVRAMMAADLSRKWTVKELSRAAGMSERGLGKLFRGVFGTPVYSCLQHMRLERGRNLIAPGGMSVTSASMAVGYDSPAHFAALFKREFGVSPSTMKESPPDRVPWTEES